ncbi:hypothetical protein Tco_0645292 [Tanacetum coccineum]
MLCKLKPYYNEQNNVAIGYKNPLCLTRTKQVQPALYNGYEIIKNNHVPTLVHNTEDTLEIDEITRRKMNDKMQDPECVTHKVKIAPPDYSKENYLATFTPHKQLTPEQIFWSQDLIKMKKEAIKEQTTASRPIKALTVFTEMHDAHTIVEARCLELEAELSNLRDKIQKDNHNELVKRFSNLEVNHLNLQLKYRNLKERFRNNPPPPTRETPDFDLVFVIRKMKASLQGTDNVIKKLKTQISNLQETRSEADRTLDFRALDFQITQLTEKVTVLQEQNELFRAENEKIKQHYKELYDSIVIKCANVTKDHVKPTVLAPGKYAIDVEPIPPRNRNNREVHLDYLRHLNESVETLHKIVEEAKVVQIVLWYLDSGCSKHMTGDRSRLKNFVNKFIGTVRFGNDHFGAIMGYGDYVIGDSVISRVYYVEGLGHNLFSVGQFCDSDLEVAFRKHSCYVRDTDGVELIKGSRGSNLYTISVKT